MSRYSLRLYCFPALTRILGSEDPYCTQPTNTLAAEAAQQETDVAMKQRLLLVLLLALTAVACASRDDAVRIPPADELYRAAYDSMQFRNYQRAEQQLKRILSRYPFTEYAVQAHLDLLYVFMQLDQPESLDEEAERFIRENPRHPQIDYVYYMQGIAYYRNLTNPLESLANIDIATRYIGDAETSFQNFSQLVSRYPESEYAPDARIRMIELKNRIARHEMIIAEYYLRRGAWVSAIQRAQRVLRDLQGTPAEIDALMVLERCYTELGLDDLAATSRRVLAANPGREPVVLEKD